MTDLLAPLRERFRARALEDLARLRSLATGNPGAQELRMLAHNLVGAAGIFGHGPLSEAARAIDDHYAAGRSPGIEEIALLERLLMEVSQPVT